METDKEELKPGSKRDLYKKNEKNICSPGKIFTDRRKADLQL